MVDSQAMAWMTHKQMTKAGMVLVPPAHLVELTPDSQRSARLEHPTGLRIEGWAVKPVLPRGKGQ